VRIGKFQRQRAFTRSDLIILLVTMAAFFFAFCLLVRTPHASRKSPRVMCTANLKQVALGFELWRQDNESKSYPMAVAESRGGSKESVDNGRMVETFLAMSAQLRTPTILICPADKKVKPTDSFAKLTRSISYFLCADMNETNASQILVGDRDVAVNGNQATSGVLNVTNALLVSWAGMIHGPNGGNVALADGSAHMVTTKGLCDLLQISGTATNNRLIIP
jgi:hypothetical protein